MKYYNVNYSKSLIPGQYVSKCYFVNVSLIRLDSVTMHVNKRCELIVTRSPTYSDLMQADRASLRVKSYNYLIGLDSVTKPVNHRCEIHVSQPPTYEQSDVGRPAAQTRARQHIYRLIRGI